MATVSEILARARRQRDRLTTSSSFGEDLTVPPSIVGQALSAPISGLSALGNVLDLPGSAVRDVLAGENPLDQFLPWNWGSGEHRTTGRDLARKFGVAGPEDTWTNFFGGIATEIATDPLTYLSGGVSALGKAGKLSKAAGLGEDIAKVASKVAGRRVGPREARFLLTPKDLIEHADEAAKVAGRPADALMRFHTAGGDALALNEKLGGNIGLGLPFSTNTVPLRLPYGQEIAKGMDVIGEAVRYGKYSPVRVIAPYVNKKVMGAFSEQGQRRFAELSKDLFRHESEAKQTVAEVATKFEESGMFDVNRVAKLTGVDVKVAAHTILARQTSMLDYIERGTALPAELSWAAPHLNDMRDTLAHLPEFESGMGLISKELSDAFAKYFPRAPVMLGDAGAQAKARAYRTTSPSQLQRDFVNHPGATQVLQQLSLDPFFQPFRENAAKRALGKKGRLDPAEIKAIEDHILKNYMGSGQLALPAHKGAATNALRDLAITFGTLDPKHIDQGIPMFEPNLLKPYLARLEHSARATGVVGVTQKLMADVADVINRTGPTPTIHDVVTRMPGINPDVYGKRVFDMLDARDFGGGTGQASNILSFMQTTDPAATHMDVLKQFGIPQDIGKDIERAIKGFTAPDEVNQFLEYFDKFTSLWKLGQTSLWPAFHWRNAVSGMYQNWIGDAISWDSFKTAHQIQQKGSIIPGLANRIPALKGMTDAAATKRLRELMFAYDITGYRQGFTPETLGDAIGTPFEGIPGASPIFRGRQANVGKWEQLNPLKASAISGEDKFVGERVGRDLAKYVEGLNRGTAFINLLEKGWDPAAAAEKSLALQVDYRNLSKFEKSVMRRVVPFYAFHRGVLPTVVEELASRPGGKLGRTIITASRARKPDEFTPDYVADTASIPLGVTAEGTRRYLTSFGAMFEDPAQLFPGSGGLKNTLLEAASRLHPIPKGLLEWMTGQTFFQRSGPGGRPIEDLDPTIGRTLANIKELATGEETIRAKPFGGSAVEFLASQSPFSRVLTTARQLTDPRKLQSPLGLVANLATGFRISDISPAAQEALLRERAAEKMKELGGKTFVRTYIPEEDMATMSPEELQQADALKLLMAQLATRSKQRKLARQQK